MEMPAPRTASLLRLPGSTSAMRVQDQLISARFLCTVGHLAALLMLFSSIENNVNRSFADTASQSSIDSAYNSSIAALCFGIVCFLFDFFAMFNGTSLFNPTVNVIQIFFHFIGSIFLSWLITMTWTYQALWPIVISCNIPTALLEIWMILRIYVFKITVY